MRRLLKNDFMNELMAPFCDLQAVQISQASPAWRDYVDYMDAIVLDGLKQSTLTSLKSMLNTLVMSNTARVGASEPV